MTDHAQVEDGYRKWLYVPLVIVIFGVFVAAAWYYFSQYDQFNTENLRAFIAGFGVWAPVAYAVIYTISAPIPFVATVLSPVGGLLFGAFSGSLLVIGVATLSSLIPFMLARQLGQAWVESKLKGNRLENVYRRSHGQGGFLFILLMRLIPVLPWEIQNYVAGISKVSVVTYLTATPLGIVPGSVGLVLIGDAVANPSPGKIALAVALNVLVAVIAPLTAALLHGRKRDRNAAVD
jgi:uncharacterized membrane protein YdjX (TVP38/TMEM64 family)